MTEEQKIKAAEEYADNFGCRIHSREDYELVKEIYADGLSARDEEIKDLQLAYNNLVNSFNERERELAKASQELNNLRNPWISVNDKLPQLNKICFGMRDGKMPRICMLVKKKNGECVFNTPNEEYEYPKGKITHWMPIPELKKGE